MSVFGKGAGYRWTDAYIMAWIAELGTDRFCSDFLDYRNDPQGRTAAQMNHAARSGCRNFAEGCERLRTSYSSGMDLLNVSVASLSELRDDYLKWLLRVKELPWAPEEVEAILISGSKLEPVPDDNLPYTDQRFCAHLLSQYERFTRWVECDDSMVRARALVILCNRARKLQEAYLEYIAKVFKRDGGFRERLGDARRAERVQQERLRSGCSRERQSAVEEESPRCPECGSAMNRKYRKTDNTPFWGCNEYPGCRGTRPYR